MPGRTVTRADLVNAICRQVRLSKSEAAGLLDDFVEEIVAALERGEAVRISSFGVLETRAKRERMGRNPKTGKAAPIAPRRVVLFRPSDVLRRIINGSPPPAQ